MTDLKNIFADYQSAWCKDQAQVKVWEKSRRIGASWCEAADDALLAAAKAGMDVWYIGYNKEMAEEFIRDASEWARVYGLAAENIEEEVVKDEDKDILTYKVRFASGYKVTALSSRPSNLRGKQGKIVIDEAAFHDDLQELLKAAFAMLIWGGRVVVISTHNGEDNAFNDLVKEIRAGKKPYSLHRTTFADAVDQGLSVRVALRRGIEWTEAWQVEWLAKIYGEYGEHAEEELDCVPAHGSGVYLSRALIENCMSPAVPVLRIARPAEFVDLAQALRESEILAWCEDNLKPRLDNLPKNLRSYAGVDFGRLGDLSVFWILLQRPNLIYGTEFVVELRNMPFEQQRQILFYILERLPRFSGAALDSRGNGQYLAEVTRQRFGASRVHQVMLSQPWYIENMPPLKAGLEDRTITLPLNTDILYDLRAVKMVKGVAKIPDSYAGQGSDGGKRHGDAAVALALGVYAVRKIEYAPVEVEIIGQGRRNSGLRRYV